MEIYQLKYFQIVGRLESIQAASRLLHVSPGALSKVVKNLEEELGVALFHRRQKSLFITDAGKDLLQRATELLELEKSIRQEVGSKTKDFVIPVSGSEYLLGTYSHLIATSFKKIIPDCQVEFKTEDEKSAIRSVVDSTSYLALLSQDRPLSGESFILEKIDFVTCVSKEHPLSGGQMHSVRDVLNYDFVSPNWNFLGETGEVSFDGWRDDIFSRKIAYRASSLSVLTQLVNRGLAVAYLPEPLAAQHGLTVLNISDCPYHCKQTISLFVQQHSKLSWLADSIKLLANLSYEA